MFINANIQYLFTLTNKITIYLFVMVYNILLNCLPEQTNNLKLNKTFRPLKINSFYTDGVVS